MRKLSSLPPLRGREADCHSQSQRLYPNREMEGHRMEGHRMYRISKAVTVSAVLVLGSLAALTPAKSNKPGAKIDAAKGTPVLWRDPGDMTSRNFFYGPGGKAHEPRGTFTFEKEDMNGTTPKFDVVDQDGVKWRVKMGPDARPETVASRLGGGSGYFANRDCFMPVLHRPKMQRPPRRRN